MIAKLKSLESMNNNPDGCSINPFTGNITIYNNGYFVALTNNIVKDTHYKEMDKIVSLAESLSMKNFFFGYWLDAETGNEYLDLSIHVLSYEAAMTIAANHSQLAIYECSTQKSLYLNQEAAVA